MCAMRATRCWPRWCETRITPIAPSAGSGGGPEDPDRMRAWPAALVGPLELDGAKIANRTEGVRLYNDLALAAADEVAERMLGLHGGRVDDGISVARGPTSEPFRLLATERPRHPRMLLVASATSKDGQLTAQLLVRVGDAAEQVNDRGEH